MLTRGRPIPLEELVEKVDAVTVESARAAGRALIARGKMAIGVLGLGSGLESAAAIARNSDTPGCMTIHTTPDHKPRMAFFRTINFSEPMPCDCRRRRGVAHAANVPTIAEWAALREASREFLIALGTDMASR